MKYGQLQYHPLYLLVIDYEMRNNYVVHNPTLSLLNVPKIRSVVHAVFQVVTASVLFHKHIPFYNQFNL